MDAHVFSINDFNLPKVFKDQFGDALHIIYLILLDKGKFQSHPDMGVGLRTRYRGKISDEVLYELNSDIRSQIDTYLPDVNLTDLKLTINENNELCIGLFVNDKLLLLSYDSENNKLNIGDDASYILDDII